MLIAFLAIRSDGEPIVKLVAISRHNLFSNASNDDGNLPLVLPRT